MAAADPFVCEIGDDSAGDGMQWIKKTPLLLKLKDTFEDLEFGEEDDNYFSLYHYHLLMFFVLCFKHDLSAHDLGRIDTFTIHHEDMGEVYEQLSESFDDGELEFETSQRLSNDGIRRRRLQLHRGPSRQGQ